MRRAVGWEEDGGREFENAAVRIDAAALDGHSTKKPEQSARLDLIFHHDIIKRKGFKFFAKGIRVG